MGKNSGKSRQAQYADIIKKNNLTKEKAKSTQKLFVILAICFILIGILTIAFIIGIILIVLGTLFACSAYVYGDIAKNYQYYASAISNSGPAADSPSESRHKHSSGDSKSEKHIVAGTSHRQDAIKSLGTPNPDYTLTKAQLVKKGLWDAPVHEYTFKTLKGQLEEEPTNEYDPNAIKVLIAGKHIGYIKKGSCTHVKKLMRSNLIKSITVTMGGGNNKCLYRCGDGNDIDSFEYESEKKPIWAKITINL